MANDGSVWIPIGLDTTAAKAELEKLQTHAESFRGGLVSGLKSQIGTLIGSAVSLITGPTMQQYAQGAAGASEYYGRRVLPEGFRRGAEPAIAAERLRQDLVEQLGPYGSQASKEQILMMAARRYERIAQEQKSAEHVGRVLNEAYASGSTVEQLIGEEQANTAMKEYMERIARATEASAEADRQKPGDPLGR